MQLRERALERAGVPVDCGLWAVGCGGLWWAAVACCRLLLVGKHLQMQSEPAMATRAFTGLLEVRYSSGSC